MSTKIKICPVCNSQSIKAGRLTGEATLKSLDYIKETDGSELLVTFCADCGEVLGIRVVEPQKI